MLKAAIGGPSCNLGPDQEAAVARALSSWIAVGYEIRRWELP